MSIFGQDILGDMKEMFSISPFNYLPYSNKLHSVGETLHRGEYEGRTFRDFGTWPLPRTGAVNRDLIEDYILNPFKFSCTNVITKKRIWVNYEQIFGIKNFHLPQLENIMLDGKFDKLLPVVQESDIETKFNGEPINSHKWYHSWEVYIDLPKNLKHGDEKCCKSYWGIVADSLKENVIKHISLDVNASVECYIANSETEWIKNLNGYPYGVTDTFAWMCLTIKINKLLGESCVWHDVGDPYLIKGCMNVQTPTISVIFKIEKTDVDL